MVQILEEHVVVRILNIIAMFFSFTLNFITPSILCKLLWGVYGDGSTVVFYCENCGIDFIVVFVTTDDYFLSVEVFVFGSGVDGGFGL